MWQSDFTHWTPSNVTRVEVISWLDEHYHMMLHPSAHHRITGKTVTDTFTQAAATQPQL